MAGNEIICNCHQVDYITIRKAMVNGARTLKEIQDLTGAATGCGGCKARVEEILASACTCFNVSIDEVVEAVNNGATTVEEVGQVTKAGTGCKSCQPLIANIIEQKK